MLSTIHDRIAKRQSSIKDEDDRGAHGKVAHMHGKKRSTRRWVTTAGVLTLAIIIGSTVSGVTNPAIAGTKVTAAKKNHGAAATTTIFGTSVQMSKGETYAQAVTREEKKLGKLRIIRKYYPGLPANWSKIHADIGSHATDLSFKAAPKTILSGKDDAGLRKWFAAAPTSGTMYWTYLAEPEDDIADGRFTAAQFRKAWVHIAKLANATKNSHLKSALVLMAWSADPTSHRNWKNYFPGKQYVDVVAWDGYNRIADGKNTYSSPAKIYGKAVAATEATNKPVAFAEVGSKLAKGDKGSGRAKWLASLGSYMRSHHAVFVCYFDSSVGGDFRLRDKPSINAWRAVITGKRRRSGPSSPERGGPTPARTPHMSRRTSSAAAAIAASFLPTSCKPIGRPSASHPAGTDIAGRPATDASAVSRANAVATSSSRSAIRTEVVPCRGAVTGQLASSNTSTSSSSSVIAATSASRAARARR